MRLMDAARDRKFGVVIVEALDRLSRERELSSLEETPQIIALHPATIGSYIATVDRLAGVLSEHAAASDDRGTLVATFRALVHSVTVHPKAPREGFQVEVKGKLAALIGGGVFPGELLWGTRGSGGALPPFPTTPKYSLLYPVVRIVTQA